MKQQVPAARAAGDRHYCALGTGDFLLHRGSNRFLSLPADRLGETEWVRARWINHVTGEEDHASRRALGWLRRLSHAQPLQRFFRVLRQDTQALEQFQLGARGIEVEVRSPLQSRFVSERDLPRPIAREEEIIAGAEFTPAVHSAPR